MKKVLSIVFCILGVLLSAAYLLELGYTYGVYHTKQEARLLYSSAPYSLEAIFLTLIFLLPSIISLIIAYVLKRKRAG